MNKQEAVAILGGDQERVEEFVTQHVFELKTNLLKGTLVPQVIKKKAKKLSAMAIALMALGFEEEVHESINVELKIEDTNVQSVIEFFRNYEKSNSQLKLLVMQAFHPGVIAGILEDIANLEGNKFSSLRIAFGEKDGETKLSEYVDSGAIISELKRVDVSKDVSELVDELPEMKKEIIKSFKYCKFVQSKSGREC